jgi:hypothetical protein
MRIRQLTWPLRGLARLGGPVRAGAQGAGAVSPEWIRAQFRRTDDGAGGRLQTLRRRVKFWMRCRLRSRALALGATAFRNRALEALAEQRPELALRPLRSYLRRGRPRRGAPNACARTSHGSPRICRARRSTGSTRTSSSRCWRRAVRRSKAWG